MIELKSQIYTISKIKKDTSAKILEKFKVDDEIYFSYSFNDKNSGRSPKVYAEYIKIVNVTQNLVKKISINESKLFFKIFDIELK